MTKAKLMELVGQEVTVIFKDGDVATGKLDYIPEISSKYEYRKPKCFDVTDRSTGITWAFKVSHIKKCEVKKS